MNSVTSYGNEDLCRSHRDESGSDVAIERLFAEGNTKSEDRCARRANLRTDYFRYVPHLFPDPDCRGIHIKQPQLLAAFSSEAIDADCCQEPYLS